MFTCPNGLSRIGFCGTGQDRHAAPRLVGNDFDDAPPLLGRKADELAGRAVRVEAMDAAIDQPVDVPAQFVFVNPTSLVQGNDIRRKDALNTIGHSELTRLGLRMIGTDSGGTEADPFGPESP